jgi:chromosome segregation ATPase
MRPSQTLPRPLAFAAAALTSLLAAACLDLHREPDPKAGGLVEPEVFDVIRASNSKAAVEQLRDRYDQEVQHAKLLEARIGELIAAEEGLSMEHRERLQALQSIKEQVRQLADEQAATARALDEATKAHTDAATKLEAMKKETAQLEAALQAEQARRDELQKKADAAKKGQ